jgi:hypothetical protein
MDKLRDMLVRSDFWLSSAVDFNDPFDVSSAVLIDGDVQERRRRFTELVNENEPSLTWKQKKERVAKLMQQPHYDLVSHFQTSMVNLRNTMGICSFASSARSILMWSHYASNHRGVCLVFDPMRDYRVFMHAHPVTYSDIYRVTSWLRIRESIVDVLTTKYTQWEYEKERRILLEGQAGKHLNYRPAALRGIVTGRRAPPYVLDTVAKLLEERRAADLPDVPHYTALQHPTEYKLVLRRAPTDRSGAARPS